ncbi:hypothetical protein SDC9_181204 [bioreactor metagenome]|uniref:Uncharacterized protein n=1 Tax=bioreactor metagenome TaxID=1076179 RepID=A0A645HD63_9ZZZZ
MGDSFSKFDDHAAEIVDHRQQHAPHVVDLLGGDGIGMGRFQLANGCHVTHAMNQIDDRLTYAFLQGIFANDIGICQREQQRCPQRVDIHT